MKSALSEVADQYGVLLVDQFGTLHDGTVAYPHAAEALRRFRESGGKVAVQAATVEVTAAVVKVDAGMSNFSGVVKCDTLISNAVISSSYTPGAGNIW